MGEESIECRWVGLLPAVLGNLATVEHAYFQADKILDEISCVPDNLDVPVRFSPELIGRSSRTQFCLLDLSCEHRITAFVTHRYPMDAIRLLLEPWKSVQPRPRTTRRQHSPFHTPLRP